MRKQISVFVVVCLFIAAGTASAATYVVPNDRELIQRSDDIVVATGVTSLVERNDRGAIVTRYTLRVEEALKGDRQPGDHLVVTELGGQLGDRIYYVAGAPVYEPGERYLVFTETNSALEPITFGMSLGQFKLMNERDRSFALRSEIFGFDGNADMHVERARDAAKFVEYIRGIVSQTIDPEPRYFVDGARAQFDAHPQWEVVTNATRNSYLMQNGGRGFRWQDPSATFETYGSAASANGLTGVGQAMGQWNGTASDINFEQGTHHETATGAILCGSCDNGINGIYLSDVANEVESGVAGIGGVNADMQYTLGGETFLRVIEGDLVMNENVGPQNCYNTVMTHEMGHTLGFRHSNTPPTGGDSTTDAIMNSVVNCAWNGVLKAYDETAAETVYGDGPVCNPPGIGTHPASKSITEGATTSLSVTATGTAPLTYQWFIGASGDTSSPTGTNSATLSNLAPTVTTSYWVRVTGQCGSPVNSNTATITVTPFVCPNVTINSATASPQSNGTFRLQVAATSTGQALTFQWFEGNTPGTGGNLVGTTATVNVTGSEAASYWARVTNACGNSAVTALLTVTPCKAVITDQPSNQTIQSGTSATLSVGFTGSGVTVRWYRATAPNKQNQVGTGPSITVGPLTATTQYWANLTNSCGETATRTVTINVSGSCTAPVITTEPLDRSIAVGGTTTLTVAFTGENATVRWYRGAAPNKDNQVGTGASINVGPLELTTQFWASVSNSCGEVESRTVTVAVTSCATPVIGTQPQSQKVKPGEMVTLSVAATGTGTLNYQWFEGAVGNETKPVGTNAPSFTSARLYASTSFWVRVTNDCANAQSVAAEIEVPKGRGRAVRHP